MNHVSMHHNLAQGFGGCIYGWSSSFDITSCDFVNNYADVAGGIAYIGDSTLNMSNCTLTSNQSPFGACIYAYASSLRLWNNTMYFNQASESGGCLFVNDSYLQLFDSNATHNSAPNGNGSVIYITNMDGLIANDIENMPNIVEISNCSFTNNEAVDGSPIFIHANHDIFPKQLNITDYEPAHASIICGNDTFCYYINVSTKANQISTALVRVAASRERQETLFKVYFNILHNDCMNPSLSLYYETIDVNEDNEHIKVLDHNQSLIAECGTSSGKCNEFVNCVIDYDFGVDFISHLDNEPFIISLSQPSTVGALCYESHRLSINALLELSCNPNSVNITTNTISSNTSCNYSTASFMIKANNIQKQIAFSPLYINQQQVGSKYINNIAFTLSHVYGHTTSNAMDHCYDTERIYIDLLSQGIDIEGSAATLFIDASCEYIDVLLKFQELGAASVVLVHVNHTLLHSDDVTKWLPFKCTIDHDSSYIHVNYSTLLHWVSSIFDTQINTTLEERTYGTNQQRDEINFIMDVTNNEDEDATIDEIIANLITTACSVNIKACPVAVREVFCEKGNIIEITNKEQSHDYIENIVIPVIVIHDALQLAPYAVADARFYVSFTCDSSQDTYFMDNDTVATMTAISNIVAYNEADGIQLVVSFPQLSFNSFYSIVSDVCDVDIDWNDIEIFSVSIRTVYNPLNSICIDGDGIHKVYSSAITIPNCGASLKEDIEIDKGTYCFIAWKLDSEIEFNYEIVSVFKWTPSFIQIDQSLFKNNIANQEDGGMISIVSQSNIDEMLSVSIINTKFMSNNGSCIRRMFSFSGIQRLLSSNMSVLSIINVYAEMRYASFLSSDVLSSIDNGMIFKNAILMSNVSIYGHNISSTSAISLQNSNAWIGSSVIKQLRTNNGAISVMNSDLQLFGSIIAGNHAQQNGAGIYQHEGIIHDYYDLCISLISNVFSENEAVSYGGAIYLNLIGTQNERESCVQLWNNRFNNNSAAIADDIYFNITNGYHSILNNNDTFNTVCDNNNNECDTFYSSVAIFCIAVTLDEAEDCESIEFIDTNTVNISSYPGASQSIYVFGRDAFRNLVPTSDYKIRAESDTIFIITPDGAQIGRNPYAYLINILMPVVYNEQVVHIIDVNHMAETRSINININDCTNTEYKHWISDELDIYTCEACANTQYTLDSSECKTCPDILKCDNGSITVKQSHHITQTLSKDQGIELQVAICPPGYCCQAKAGCAYQFGTNPALCAANRNSSVRMCGACITGYSETSSSQGNCKRCNSWQGPLWLIVYVIFGYFVVMIIFQLSTSQRTVPSPLVTYLNRTLFFYYQILAFITFRSYIPLLYTITDIFNLNLTISRLGACLYLPHVGPRQKLVMSLTIPVILITSFIFTFVRFFLRYQKVKSGLIQRPDDWWHSRIIAFANTADVLVRIIYLQLTYICLRLCVCNRYEDGKWYMWYAGQVPCFDGWHVIAALLLLFFVVIFPFIFYRLQLFYKYNNPEYFEKIFANTILSYRQPCWYYGVIDLFRRAAIVVISISTYSSWMICCTGSLLVLHCTLMPYRWRVNNFLEMFVLAVIFLASVLNDTDLAQVAFAGIVVDFDPVLIVFVFLPLLPVPWLIYECGVDLSTWNKIHFIGYIEMEDGPSENNIIFICRSCNGIKTYACYVGDKIINKKYTQINQHSIQPQMDLEEDDIDDDEAQSENEEEEKNSEEVTGAVISATPTRNGWKYPFKIPYALYCCYYSGGRCVCRKRSKDVHDVDNESVTVDLMIIFSDDIPANTFIDSTDIAQHLSYWTKKLGCTIFINRVSGKRKEFMVELSAQWQNVQNLDPDLLQIGYDLAMQEALYNALDHNNELKKDLMKSFKIAPSQQNKEIKVIDVEIKGSLSNEDRNKYLMQQLLHTHALSDEETTKELDKIKYLPLHRWSVQDLKIKIKNWVLNDCQHKERTEILMNIFSEKSLSGKRIINLGNELKIVLKNAIGNELLMTHDTFDIIYQHLYDTMQDDEGRDRLSRKNAPQMALMISRVALQNILDRIDAEKINGAKFIKYYETDIEWIYDTTGWLQTEILQIETVLLKHQTYLKYKITEKLTKNISTNMSRRIRKEFGKRIESEASEDYIDLEVLHLKLINGYTVDEEADILMNVADDLQKMSTHKTERAVKQPLNLVVEANEGHMLIASASNSLLSDVFSDVDEEKYSNDEEFIPNLLKSVAACFALSVSSEKQLIFQESVRGILRQRSPSDDTLAGLHSSSKNQRMKVSKQTDWICSNCGNQNHKFHVGGKWIENWKECYLCGVKELNSVVHALEGKYTYVSAARSIYDKDDTVDNNMEDDAESKQQFEITLSDNSTFNMRKISCPLRSSQTACKRVERLAKQLQTYQQWIKKVHQEKGETPSVAETSKVDLNDLDNEDFKRLAMESTEVKKLKKKIKEKHKKRLQEMLEDKLTKHDMITLDKNAFVDKLMEGMSLKKGPAAKLYTVLKRKCQNAVKSGKYKEYINALDFETTDDDFFHVLNFHIKYGGQTKLNTFDYFRHVVACDFDKCDSKKRKKTRVERFKTKITEEVAKNNMNTKEIDPFKLRQRYVQNQLDVMHYFLVHPQERGGSEYEQLTRSDQIPPMISNTFDINLELVPLHQESKKSRSISNKHVMDNLLTPDQQKYVTQISTEDASTAEYGFGVDHSYPHIEPKTNANIRDELLFNDVCKVKDDDFEDIIMRALKMQRIAIKEKQLRCKHYETEYNIIRNECIGVRHMLSIIIYTDLTEFCTAFRATYRAQNKSETEHMVTQRHRDLYFYSRALFEAVEFFGNSMEAKMRVYHGLSEVMMFERFTAYFNQPVSTTAEVDTALQFSKGVGIILEFKRAGRNPSLIPKYLDVSWMSIFPEEDERLFYGDNIVFEIANIIETKGTPKHHRQDLKILNMFQRMVKNQAVEWSKTNEKEYDKLEREITLLVWLINDKIGMKRNIANASTRNVSTTFDLTPGSTLREIEEEAKEIEHHLYLDEEITGKLVHNTTTHALQQLSIAGMLSNKASVKDLKKGKISHYGRDLFAYFCNNPKTTWICINNYQLIPSKLKHALLYNKANNSHPQLSFIKVLQLFQCLEKVVLNELNVKQMTQDCKHYVKAVTAYIKHINGYKPSIKHENEYEDDEKTDTSQLKEIVFESVAEIDSKPNSTLQKLALHYEKLFENKTFWSIKYKFLLERTHTLTFKNTSKKQK